ncbi:hypothetical protein HXX76_008681 [Chlamydomonas incerta]|uniref:Small ribosomal subunit biogenesis GTPase RsgA n=1 Tax=Chlamydomonas incerta TaxID=51695 RepID=A0A835STQ7_CHLIN|nr:hypothetical protein HXX76_008681 [Chlamydomonas incerta]|eukprot:KAG2432953.1 hypothetical protein HXX76_008681 [Chlamydomonas incerta]
MSTASCKVFSTSRCAALHSGAVDRTRLGLPATAPSQTPLTSGLGQVIAASSNFVRVQLYNLLPDSEPTPDGWRPPHMRDRGGDAGGGAPPAAGATGAQAAATQPAVAEPSSDTGAYPVLLCSLRSLLRKLRQDVVVGDVVRVEAVDWVAGRGAVSEVLPRSSRLTDPAVANVEHALLVFALDTPPFEEQQVSRFLVAYEAAGVPFSLVLNKADLVSPEVLAGRLAQCRAWGYEPVVLSCETGEGVEQVAARLSDRVSVVAGPSGAGKSSLINLLRRGRHRPDLQAAPGAAAANVADEERAQAELERAEAEAEAAQAAESAQAAQAEAGRAGTARGRGRAVGSDEPMPLGGLQELVKLPSPGVLGLGLEARGVGSDASAAASADGGAGEAGAAGALEPEFLAVGALSKMGRGMHTTTSISLLRLLGGGWLADTPGFGQPTLDDISSPELAACFPEVAHLVEATPCRFSDCLHVAEPGCAVRGAGLERYTFYLRFLQDIRAREANDVTRLQRARADREGYAKAKSVRGGGERLEARLDSKRHRRTSRQSGRRAGDLD